MRYFPWELRGQLDYTAVCSEGCAARYRRLWKARLLPRKPAAWSSEAE